MKTYEDFKDLLTDEEYYEDHPFYCPYGSIMAKDMEIWKRRHQS